MNILIELSSVKLTSKYLIQVWEKVLFNFAQFPADSSHWQSNLCASSGQKPHTHTLAHKYAQAPLRPLHRLTHACIYAQAQTQKIQYF